jgi:DNA polymerase
VIIPPPPRLEDLPAGTSLLAGLGRSTVLADLDFETYSEAGYAWDASRRRWVSPPRAAGIKRGIEVVGSARYAEHPSTIVLCLAYDLKDGRGKRQWLPGHPPPLDLFEHIAVGGLIEAWNVSFERHIWERVCVPRMGWPPVPRQQWRCAMAKARAFALPGGLAKAADVLGTQARKNEEGRRLLKRFSVPRNPTKDDDRLRLDPATDDEGPALYAYNTQDIATEAEVSSLLPDLQPEELAWWQTDQEINCRGVQIDTAGVENCLAVVDTALSQYHGELAVLTGGAVSAASEVAALLAWLGTTGVYLTALDDEAVSGALARTDLPAGARRALEIRALTSSASVKKLNAMTMTVCADGRARDLYTYHGARTGRATGGALQPTNLPNHGPEMRRCGICARHCGKHHLSCAWCGGPPGEVVEWNAAAVEDVLYVARSRSLPLVEWFFGPALAAISGCLRGLLIAAPGHDLIASDFSAIEAVVLAELAGEDWRRGVFRTHGKIYEMSASKITGVPFEDIMEHRRRTGQHHPLRKKVGKVAELALGYQGWIGAMQAFGADEFMTPDEMKDAILKWREASPAIVDLWGGQRRKWREERYGLEGAFVDAIQNPGKEFDVRGMKVLRRGDVVYIRLLSGRHLTYHKPRLERSDRRENEMAISYQGWNTNPKNGGVGWIEMRTWGGRLVENVTQATARDIQRHSLVAQERAGYPIVLHIYDENVAEVPEGWGSVEEFERLMATMPDWAAGWPVRAAGGWRGKRYRKD